MHLAQIGGTPNLAGFGNIVIWFSLVVLALLLGVIGSIEATLARAPERPTTILLFGFISVALGFLTFAAPVTLLYINDGFSSFPAGELVFVILLSLASIFAGTFALFLWTKRRT